MMMLKLWPDFRVGMIFSIVLLAGALAITPSRVRFAAQLHRMPQYGPLVDGSRALALQGRPLREIRTEFSLPPTSDSAFIYQILGGRIDRASPLVGVITSDGRGEYQQAAIP